MSFSSARAAYRDEIRRRDRAMVERGLACSYPVGTRVLERCLCEPVPDGARPHLEALRRAMAAREPIADHLTRVSIAWPAGVR